MTDQNEKLSLLLDDHDAEDAATLDEVMSDVNLQYRARRYRMIGEAMRHELPPAIDTGFHATVMARVQDQSEAQAYDFRSKVTQEAKSKHSLLSWLTLKPLVGLAVAVSVAMVTVTWWQQESGQVDEKIVTAEGEKIQELARQKVQGGAVPVSTRVKNLGTRWKVEHDLPGLQQKLNAYLVTHTEQSGSMQGLIPQARVAGFDAKQ
jgi:negative regulator of sigma E activity